MISTEDQAKERLVTKIQAKFRQVQAERDVALIRLIYHHAKGGISDRRASEGEEDSRKETRKNVLREIARATKRCLKVYHIGKKKSGTELLDEMRADGAQDEFEITCISQVEFVQSCLEMGKGHGWSREQVKQGSMYLFHYLTEGKVEKLFKVKFNSKLPTLLDNFQEMKDSSPRDQQIKAALAIVRKIACLGAKAWPACTCSISLRLDCSALEKELAKQVEDIENELLSLLTKLGEAEPDTDSEEEETEKTPKKVKTISRQHASFQDAIGHMISLKRALKFLDGKEFSKDIPGQMIHSGKQNPEELPRNLINGSSESKDEGIIAKQHANESALQSDQVGTSGSPFPVDVDFKELVPVPSDIVEDRSVGDLPLQSLNLASDRTVKTELTSALCARLEANKANLEPEEKSTGVSTTAQQHVRESSDANSSQNLHSVPRATTGQIPSAASGDHMTDVVNTRKERKKSVHVPSGRVEGGSVINSDSAEGIIHHLDSMQIKSLIKSSHSPIRAIVAAKGLPKERVCTSPNAAEDSVVHDPLQVKRLINSHHPPAVLAKTPQKEFVCSSPDVAEDCAALDSLQVLRRIDSSSATPQLEVQSTGATKIQGQTLRPESIRDKFPQSAQGVRKKSQRWSSKMLVSADRAEDASVADELQTILQLEVQSIGVPIQNQGQRLESIRQTSSQRHHSVSKRSSKRGVMLPPSAEMVEDSLLDESPDQEAAATAEAASHSREKATATSEIGQAQSAIAATRDIITSPRQQQQSHLAAGGTQLQATQRPESIDAGLSQSLHGVASSTSKHSPRLPQTDSSTVSTWDPQYISLERLRSILTTLSRHEVQTMLSELSLGTLYHCILDLNSAMNLYNMPRSDATLYADFAVRTCSGVSGRELFSALQQTQLPLSKRESMLAKEKIAEWASKRDAAAPGNALGAGRYNPVRIPCGGKRKEHITKCGFHVVAPPRKPRNSPLPPCLPTRPGKIHYRRAFF